MSNEFELRCSRAQIQDRFAEAKVPLRWADADPGRRLDELLRPTDRGTVIRPDDPAAPPAGLYGADIRWWMVPYFHRATATDWKTLSHHAPIETLDTAPIFREAYAKRRCLVPVTAFFEYSTPPGWRKGQPKTRHEIAWPGGDLRFFAGVWDRTDEDLESFAIVTGPAGPDMAPIHDRQPPLMSLDQGLQWLRLDGPGKGPLHELPAAGGFTVQQRPRESLMSAAMRRALP